MKSNHENGVRRNEPGVIVLNGRCLIPRGSSHRTKPAPPNHPSELSDGYYSLYRFLKTLITLSRAEPARLVTSGVHKDRLMVEENLKTSTVRASVCRKLLIALDSQECARAFLIGTCVAGTVQTQVQRTETRGFQTLGSSP